MNTYMRYFRGKVKVLGLFLWPLLFSAVRGQDVNGTQQLVNRGFEEYDNWGKAEVEPVGWNSFYTAKTNSLTSMGVEQRLEPVSGGRPGTSGQYCMRVFSTTIIGVKANGNVTTGRINMGSATADDPSNHNFTDRASSGFNYPFTSVPDSLVIWAKYSPDNASDQGQINAIIHDDFGMKDPGADLNHAVAVATVNPVKGDGGWVRYSVPFRKDGCGSKDPRYILVSITSNKKPGGGTAQIWVDDILFIYRPALGMGSLPALSFNMRDGAQTFDIPFTITGTMSPNTYPANPNQVIAEISDASGSFGSPRPIGQMQTDQSGKLTVTLPSDMPLGDHYRIRLRSTNYPLMTPDNGQDIVLMRGFTVSLAKNADFGTVVGNGAYKEGSSATVRAVPNIGYHFVRWEENGKEVAGAGDTYTFTVDRDRSLVAVFEVNTYPLELAVEGNGDLDPAAGTYFYAHNARVTLAASPHPGYELKGFYNGQSLLSSNPVYAFNVTSAMKITAVFEPGKLQVTASANASALGTVKGSGLYAMGSQVTLTAEPMPFCSFVAWMEGPDTVSRESVYRFTVEKNRTLTALFSEQFYEVSLTSQPSQGGVLSGSGRFSAAKTNTDIVLNAQANEGYVFLYWESETDGGRISENPYRYMEQGRLTEDLSFTAYFEAIRCEIGLSCEPASGGNTGGAGEYAYKQSASLQAFPAEGYDFVAWVDASGDTLSYDNPYVFPAKESLQIRALFVLQTHRMELAAEPVAYGTTEGGGNYIHGDTAYVRALAAEGYRFRYWALRRGLGLDSLSCDNPYAVPMLSDCSLVAVFQPRPKQVRAVCIPSQAGSVTGTGDYQAGTYAWLQAVESYGYHFDAWVDSEGNPVHFDRSLRLPVSGDTVLRALFAPNTYTLRVMTEGTQSVGKISTDGISYAVSQSREAFYGDTLDIRARAEEDGYRFSQWTVYYQENGRQEDSVFSRDEKIRFVLSGDVTLVASFLYEAREITARVRPEADWGRVRNQGNYREGDWIELKAEACNGYAFSHWADCREGRVLERNPSFLVPVLSDTAFCAFFKKDTVRIQAFAGGKTGSGSVSGSGRYEYGSDVRLQAVPEYGYALQGWYRLSDTALAECLHTESEYVFPAVSPLELQAVFSPVRFRLQAQSFPEGAGTVSGTGGYPYGEKALIEARAGAGYVFSCWLVSDGSEFDTVWEPLTRIAMLKDCSATALFKSRVCKWEAVSDDISKGVVEGNGRGDTVYGSDLLLVARPAYGYRFGQWKDRDGNTVSLRDSLRVHLQGDTLLYAVFDAVTLRLEAAADDPARGYVESYPTRVPFGSQSDLEARPMPGYVFDRWTSRNDTLLVVSVSSKLRILMRTDTALTAFFKPADYALTVSSYPENSGSAGIWKAGPDTACSGDFSLAGYGDAFLLKARPAPHYVFSSWQREGITLGENSVLDFDVDGDASITALFEPEIYQLTLQAEPVSYGTVDGQGAYAYGSSPAVTARAGQQYVFVGWKSNDGWISDSARMRIALDRDTVLTAVFEIDSVSIGLQASSGGQVSGGGRFVRSGEVVLEAIPYPGYAFSGWTDLSGNRISEDNPYVFPALEDRTYRAEFVSMQVGIDVSATEGGTVRGGGTYVYGSPVSLFALADSGYVFEKWLAQGMELSEMQARSPYLGVDACREMVFEARFVPKKYRLSTLASPLDCGSVTAGGDFDFGASVSFEARPDANHAFVAWTLEGKTVSRENVLVVNVGGDARYVAVFEPRQVKTLVTAYPEDGGLTYGSGTYYWGDTVRIGITPYSGYEFENWTNSEFTEVSRTEFFDYQVVGVDMFTATLTGGDTSVDPDEPEPGPGPEDPDTEPEQKRFRVYPNPVGRNGIVHIEMESPDLVYVRIFSLSGRHILYRKISEDGTDKARLELPAHLKGCYVYELGLKEGNVRRGKLIRL